MKAECEGQWYVDMKLWESLEDMDHPQKRDGGGTGSTKGSEEKEGMI